MFTTSQLLVHLIIVSIINLDFDFLLFYVSSLLYSVNPFLCIYLSALFQLTNLFEVLELCISGWDVFLFKQAWRKCVDIIDARLDGSSTSSLTGG